MNPQTQFLLSVASLVVATLALGISVMNAFPGVKTLLAVFRDGVLWLALFFVLGGAGFVAYQRFSGLSATGERNAGLTMPGSTTPADPRGF
jgi:hypothetical protein